MENEPEELTKPEVKKQTELSSCGELASVTVSYSLSMCLEEQRAGLGYSVSVPCFEGHSFIDAFKKADKICEAIHEEKLKEVQEMVCHLKNTKNKIEKDKRKFSSKAKNDAS